MEGETTSAIVTAVNTAVSGAVSDVTSILTTNLPLILGIAVLWVGYRIGKRLISSTGSSRG